MTVLTALTAPTAPTVPTAPTDVPSAAAVATQAPRATALVTVTGPLDATTLPRIQEELEQAVATRPAGLVVDLSACTFVDASALAVLLDVHRRMSRTGGVLTLHGCCARVLRLLSLTGLRRVFALA